jgi:hypothetical protein
MLSTAVTTKRRYRMNKVERLAEILGGKQELAALCGVDKSMVTRFAKKGEIPVRYRACIIGGLRAVIERRASSQTVRDAWLEEVSGLLPPDVCACCGQPLGGRVV